MAVHIQKRRDTAANWTSVDPVLADGEAGYETDTGKEKTGDGTTEWTALAYFGSSPVPPTLEQVLGEGNDAGSIKITNLAEPTISTDAATKGYADALVTNLWDDRGNFDASVNAYPSSGGSGTAGAILKGDIWTISVAGTLPTGLSVVAGDTVRALVDTPGNTEANWAIAENNIGYDPVQSVDGDVVDNTDPTNPTINKADILKLPISRTITDSDTLAGSDVNSILDVNIGTAKTLTVTPQADESVFYILRRGVGELTFVESGVTITPSLGALTDGGEDVIVALIFTSTTTATLQNGSPVSISSSDVIAALGYTPANADRQWSLPVLKPSDQIVNHASPATITDITSLSFPVVAGLYEIRGWFLMDAANTTEGNAIQLHTDATVVYTRQAYEAYSSATAKLFRPANAEDGIATNASTLQANGINSWYGFLEVSNSGTAQFGVQTEGNSINVTVQKDSGFEYRKIR